MSTQNGGSSRPSFNPSVTQALGEYVYALLDPRDRKLFYVGKGVGSRVLSHFSDADPYWDVQAGRPQVLPGMGPISPKIMRILEVWQSGNDVEWVILAYDISSTIDGRCATADEFAFEIEAVVIDALDISQNGTTLNEISGQRRLSKGPLESAAVFKLGWPPVNPSSRYPCVFVFQIQKALAEGRTVYDATRRAWGVSAALRNTSSALAVGVEYGFSQGVFDIKNWFATGSKWEFSGTPLLGHELDQRDWNSVINIAKGHLQFGGGFLVVEFDGAGRFRFIKGHQNKSAWWTL